MRNEEVDAGLSEIADTIGADVAFLAPPDERRFDPVTVLLGLGGLLLTEFFRGFTAAAAGEPERLGRESWGWLRDRVTELFGGVRGEEANETRDAARQASTVVEHTSPEEVLRYADLSQGLLEEFLIEEGLPRTKAVKLAVKVRRVADRVALAPPAG